MARAPQAGEVFRYPDLARTLKAIAESGGEAFTAVRWRSDLGLSRQHDAALNERDLAAIPTIGAAPSRKKSAMSRCTRYRPTDRASRP